MYVNIIYFSISFECIFKGDQRFEDAALQALDGLWKAKSSLGMVGKLCSLLVQVPLVKRYVVL